MGQLLGQRWVVEVEVEVVVVIVVVVLGVFS